MVLRLYLVIIPEFMKREFNLRIFVGVIMIVGLTSNGWSQEVFKDFTINYSISEFRWNADKYVPSKKRYRVSTEAMVTNRPGVSESSKAVYKGGFQIETGFQFADVNRNHNSQVPNLGLLYGVSDRVEVRLFTTLNINQLNLNNLDTYVGVKVNVLKQGDFVPELALVFNQEIPRVFLNNGNSINPFWKSNFLAAWSYAFPKKVSIAGNLKYAFRTESKSEGIDVQNQFGYTLNGGYEIKKNIGVFAEIYGDKIIVKNIGWVHNVDGGVWYRFDPSFQIDAQVGYGLNEDYNFFMIGFSKLIM